MRGILPREQPISEYPFMKHLPGAAAPSPDHENLSRDDAKAILRERKRDAGGRGRGPHATFIKEAPADTLRRAVADPDFYHQVERAGSGWRILLLPAHEGRDANSPTVPVYEPRAGAAPPAPPDTPENLLARTRALARAFQSAADELNSMADRLEILIGGKQAP